MDQRLSDDKRHSKDEEGDTFTFKTDKARQAAEDERKWELRRTKNVKVKKNPVKILMLVTMLNGGLEVPPLSL